MREEFEQPNALVKYDEALNQFFDVDRYISLRDHAPIKSPEHLPKGIDTAFKEGAACLSIACYNAAGTMFRLCLDLATRPLLPDPADTNRAQPDNRQRRELGRRIGWLLDNSLLSGALRELAKCIREDGNDGAHAGTLTKEDAEDILDFTFELLERLYTEPKRLELAEARRLERRKK